jgi:hypothetical protein
MVSAGNEHCLALKSDGSLWAWGDNDSGQLGIGRDDFSVPVPTQIGADKDWVAVSAGLDHSLALKVDGSLYAWGANTDAQLGDQLGDAYEPVLISRGWGLASVEGDFDGDGFADPYVVDAHGAWTIWLSSGGYLPSGPYIFSVPGGEPMVADFDGDGLADPAMVANGNWTIWLSSGGYLPSGPYVMSVPGGQPVAGDFDGDRLADPAMVSANGAWTFWFSSDVKHLPWGPYVMSVPGGKPMVADFDGDGLADPGMVVNHHWTIWLSSGGYLLSGPYAFVP